MNKKKPDRPRLQGRASDENPPNRFESLYFEPDDLLPEDQRRQVPTQFFEDPSRTIISRNDSPDVGFDVSVNPYRGCEHGCIYCYARPTHEYLGFSAGLDFETRILVKTDAPRLLRRELMSRRWVPQPLAFSGVTDPYQPAESKLQLTRGCLEVLAEFLNPLVIVTKNFLVTRDIDLLDRLVRHQAAVVNISLTTLDADLQRQMEPRASTPARRLEAISLLAAAGIPARVLLGPIIPGLNDHEIPAILRESASRGATLAGYILLRLPYGLRKLFEEWLAKVVPERKEKVLSRIRDTRGGELNDSRYQTRMSGEGLYADQIRQLFRLNCTRYGLSLNQYPLSAAAFRKPHSQGNLFG